MITTETGKWLRSAFGQSVLNLIEVIRGRFYVDRPEDDSVRKCGVHLVLIIAILLSRKL